VALILLGIVGIGIGAYADAQRWWVDKPFLTNMASSIVASCFGIPLAIVVVQRLISVQAARQVRIRWGERMGSQVAIVRGLSIPFARPRLNVAREPLEALQRALDPLQSITDVRGNESAKERARSMDANQLATYLKSAFIEMDKAVEAWNSVLPNDQHQLTDAWRSFREQWRALDRLGRQRASELDEPWIDSATARQIERGDPVDPATLFFPALPRSFMAKGPSYNEVRSLIESPIGPPEHKALMRWLESSDLGVLAHTSARALDRLDRIIGVVVATVSVCDRLTDATNP
jgi:hypothetical protein